jgi:hypothetical protein
MKNFAAILFGLLPALAFAAPTANPVFGCGSTEEKVPSSLKEAHLRHAKRDAAPFPMIRRQAGNSTVIPTYFHVVSTTGNANSVQEALLQDQLDVMNKAYSSTGFSFQLVDTDFTANNAWAEIDVTSSDDSDMMAMKNKLRKGKYSELNVYFIENLANGILGMCEFPTKEIDASDPSSFSFDGCLVHSGTLPGANEFPGKFDQGMTSVHEIGHWFGLFHVFQGSSCSSDGDLVSDTPFQSSATSGCPTNKDSCPNSPGTDSVNNYMDYSDDKCYSKFTPGQIKRAQDIWGDMREGN